MAATFLAAGSAPDSAAAAAPVRSGGSTTAPAAIARITRSEAEWRRLLTAEQYRVLRQKGTERAFSGRYWNHEAVGTYTCAGCGLELFSSRAKYDSGTGWPSYFEPIAAGHVREVADTSLGMVRTEIVCARCDGHIGHVFADGPQPTGLRYCMNSAALSFVPARGESREAPSSAPGAAGAAPAPAAGSGGKR